MYFTDRDIELINMLQSNKNYSERDIVNMNRIQILDLTDSLGDLIGYDKISGDIDKLGLEADLVISKLLKLLEKRGEM